VTLDDSADDSVGDSLIDAVDEPPQYVAEHVRDVLAVDDRVAALDIRVRIVGRKVFLTGTVATEARRAVVTDLVTTQLPEHEIHNELAVTECSEASEAEVETLT
jgi:type II secretory pathway component PulK